MSRTRVLLAFVSSLIFTGAGCISFGGTTAVGPTGVFRSADKGETWAQINTLPTPKGLASIAGVRTYKIFNDPSDSNAMYLASRGQGLFFSYNRGESWQKVDALGDRFIYAVSVDPSDKCTIYAADDSSIFKTTDCSRTWKTVYSDLNARHLRALTIDPSSPQTIFAILLSGDLLRSTNSGESWKVIKTFGDDTQLVTADPQTPGRLYVAGVRSGLARSDDGGTTWINVTKGLESFSDSLSFYRLVLHPREKNTIYWVSKYGILVSKDAGATWAEMKLLNPPGSINIYALAINPFNTKEMYYVGTILGENGANRSSFYKTTDGGNNWVTKKLPTNTIPVSLHIYQDDKAARAENGSMLFMGFTVLETK